MLDKGGRIGQQNIPSGGFGGQFQWVVSYAVAAFAIGIKIDPSNL